MTNSVTITNGYALTADERLSLAACEAEIQSASDAMRDAWRRIGAALARIRDGRLYRAWCNTFEEYVESRWQLPRSSAYEWLEAAGVVRNIEAHAVAYAVVIDPPSRISHANELARLPVTQQAPALVEAREAAAANGRSEPTLYEVRRVVTARLGEPTPRTNAETTHEREQRALCDHVRRIWPRIDGDKRIALLSELVAMDDEGNTHDDDDDTIS